MVDLSDREIERIETACRSWMGRRIPKPLKKIIKEYVLNVYINGNSHYEFELNGKKLSHPYSSSDWRSGRNFGKKLVDFIKSS